MKKTLSILFKISIGIVLLGKLSNFFLHYDDKTNEILNISMFCLIGIAYLAIGFNLKKLLLKAIFIISGLYLIAMNFAFEFQYDALIGVFCIIVPLLLRNRIQSENRVKTA